MVTRRTVLKGAAASSIAAIASARGVAAAPDDGMGALGLGFGSLEEGGAAVFHKVRLGFKAMLKFHRSGAELFYKVNDSSAMDVFFKFYKEEDGWSKIMPIDSVVDVNKELLKAGFLKFHPDAATFFVKLGDQRTHYLNVGADGQYDFQPSECYQPD